MYLRVATTLLQLVADVSRW